MQHLKTENCVICGKKAECWHGHVIGVAKYALGYSNKKVIAGFCNEHAEIENEDGCYGDYSSSKMGKCIPLFGN